MRRREFITLLGGMAAVWPMAAYTQQQAMPVIGYMSARSPEDSGQSLAAFHKGLAEGGFVDGQNVSIEYRWAHGDYGRLPAFVSELTGKHVNLLAAVGGDPSAQAARAVAPTIPVVFTMGGDPVQAGLVQSFNRPGGNITGIVALTSDAETKRLGLLHEVVPGTGPLGVLVNPQAPQTVGQLRDLRNAIPKLDRQVLIVEANDDVRLNAAFAMFLREHVVALQVTADPYFDTRRERLIAFAAQNRLPTMFQFREFTVAGGLMSYGPDILD